jgi:hypothetical protein
MRPTTPQLAGEGGGGAADLVEHRGGDVDRRQRAGRVARVHAGLLDVFHDPGDDDGAAVGDRVDVELGRVVEELVDQDRVVRGRADRRAHVLGELASGLWTTRIARPPST